MQGYYLIGTYFTFYTEKVIFGRARNFYTGIYTLAEVNAIKSSFQSHEKTIMEGICLLDGITGYCCLTGLFVNSQHLEGLKEWGIDVAQGGYLLRLDHQRGWEKYSWGTIDEPERYKLAATFCIGYSIHEADACLYLGYGSNKPALISHLWRDNDLVFGNKENSQFTSRTVIGEKILQSWDSIEKYITYSLSFS
jgi:hypothetical protein